MNRRKFIELNGWLFGFTFAIGSGSLLMNACVEAEREMTSDGLGNQEAEILNELAGIIIPTTDTPGAKESNPGQYIVLIHNDCLNEEEQHVNKDHFTNLLTLLQVEKGNEIQSIRRPETVEIVNKLDQDGVESYMVYKHLITSAFLSSELGASKFLKFSLVPGRYNGCTTERPW